MLDYQQNTIHALRTAIQEAGPDTLEYRGMMVMCKKKLEEGLYRQVLYEKKLLGIPGVQSRRDVADLVSDEGVVDGCGFDQPEEKDGEDGGEGDDDEEDDDEGEVDEPGQEMTETYEDDALQHNVAEFREFLAEQ